MYSVDSTARAVAGSHSLDDTSLVIIYATCDVLNFFRLLCWVLLLLLLHVDSPFENPSLSFLNDSVSVAPSSKPWKKQ